MNRILKHTAIVCFGIGIACAIAVSSGRLSAQEGVTRVHFIDVGRGDASLLEFPCGAVLVDAGGGVDTAPALTGYLDRFFDQRPDLNRTLAMVVLTHGHEDHTRNFPAVLDQFKINLVLMNGHFNKKGHKGLQDALAAHPETKLRIADLEDVPAQGLWDPEIDALDCLGDVGGPFPDIRLLWGDARPRLDGWKAKAYKDENNHSVALLVRWGDGKALFTGDLEGKALREMRKRYADVLHGTGVYQISHHGLRSGVPKGFIELLEPEVSVLSRPADRALYEPTLDYLNDVISTKRPPVTVRVWNFENDLPDSKNPDAKGADRTRPERDGVLSAGVYWTGVDGTIVVEMQVDGSVSLQTER